MIIPCKKVKNLAFRPKKMLPSKDLSDIQSASKNMKFEIQRAKQNYKEKLEYTMTTNKLGSAWSCMKSIADISLTQIIAVPSPLRALTQMMTST